MTSTETTSLKAFPLFSSLTNEEFEELISIGHLMRVAKGDAIIEPSTRSKGLFVVVHGHATCTLPLYQGGEASLISFSPGEFFGELSILDGGFSTTAVTSEDDAMLFCIERTAFDALRNAGSPTAYKVIRAIAPSLCKRLRLLNARLAEIYTHPQHYLEATSHGSGGAS